ncbi:MAG: GNAT family N-acetyltransferase [Crocinitomicaceae bacterium]|nr:GNAT family N-acetyltransferase [Crocinitomicaceae bacterium]
MQWSEKDIFLRNVEIADLSTILAWENNTENWSVSGTEKPFTEEEIADFIVEQMNPAATNQLRLIICLNTTQEPIGTIDLFDIDRQKQTAGVGILINKQQHREKGYATQALKLVKTISKNTLHLLQLHCSIQPSNTASIQLFSQQGFKKKSIDKELIHYYCVL